MKRCVYMLTFATSITLCVSSVLADADLESGKKKYTELCASCHGDSGAGDGPVGKALPPAMKPRNFQEGAFKYATDLPKFTELLKKGGAAVGLNPMMPPQSGLQDGDYENLYAYVQSLKK